jgi:hypothetical protein
LRGIPAVANRDSTYNVGSPKSEIRGATAPRDAESRKHQKRNPKLADKWFITLSGDSNDLTNLAKTFKSPELSVVERSGEKTLESSDFNDTDTAATISEKATTIVSQLNGARRLALGSLTPVKFTVHKLREDGVREIFLSGRFEVLPRMTGAIRVANADGTFQEISDTDPILSWMLLARSDAKVAAILKQLNVSDWSSWVNLYRMLEIVASDQGSGKVGLQAIVSQGWATEDDLLRFRYTANSFKEIAEEARHGDESATHPPNPIPTPMTRQEARLLVERILHHWLRAKDKAAKGVP